MDIEYEDFNYAVAKNSKGETKFKKIKKNNIVIKKDNKEEKLGESKNKKDKNQIKTSLDNIKNTKFKKIEQEKIIDEFLIDKNFDFNKNNIQYSWEDEEFITNYTKKSEYGNLIYLVCTKRGVNGKDCKGKAKFDRKTGKIAIYERINNDKNNHNKIKFEDFVNLLR